MTEADYFISRRFAYRLPLPGALRRRGLVGVIAAGGAFQYGEGFTLFRAGTLGAEIL